MKKIRYDYNVIQTVIQALETLEVQGLKNAELITIAGKLLKEQGEEGESDGDKHC